MADKKLTISVDVDTPGVLGLALDAARRQLVEELSNWCDHVRGSFTSVDELLEQMEARLAQLRTDGHGQARLVGRIVSDTTGPVPAVTDDMIEAAARTFAVTPWDVMPEALRELCRERAERILEAALAGRTVVDLPAVQYDEDNGHHVETGGRTVYASPARGGSPDEPPFVRIGNGRWFQVHNPHKLAGALIACWLASESSGDGGSDV